MRTTCRFAVVFALAASPFVSVEGVGADPTVRPAAGAKVEDPIVAYTFVRGAPARYGKGPEPLRVKAGDTVLWTNHDPVPHDVSFETIPFADYLPPGESAEYTFTEPGEYVFHCHAHAQAPNMHGMVYVD